MRNKHFFMSTLLVAVLGFSALASAESATSSVKGADIKITQSTASAANELSIRAVSHTLSAGLDSQVFSVGFVLSAAAAVQLNIYDREDYLIRRIDAGPRTKGEQRIEWDRRDSDGHIVPAGVYTYAIHATQKDQSRIYDLSDLTGGEIVAVDAIAYDAATKKLTFQTAKPGMVLLRAGIKDGMLLKTVVNVQPYPAGSHEIRWDGWDESHTIDLGTHPRLSFAGEAWGLPTNAVMLSSGAESKPQEYQRPSTERRDAGEMPFGRNIHYYYERVGGRDVSIEFTSLSSNASAAQPLTGPSNFRVVIAPSDLPFINTQRYEVVFFLNGSMLYENETAYSPFTWRWDPSLLPAGQHVLTAVISTFSGYFGSASLIIHTAGSVASKQETQP
jgi:flagellar hook assembly protein FlgD